MPYPVTQPIRALTAWITAISGKPRTAGDIPGHNIPILEEPDKLGGRWQGSDAIGGLNDNLRRQVSSEAWPDQVGLQPFIGSDLASYFLGCLSLAAPSARSDP